MATLGMAGVAVLVACASGSATVGSVSAPAADADGSVVLTASGDIGTTAEASATLQDIGALGSDLHLAVGDLSYGATGSEAEWCDFVTDRVGRGFPFQLVPGNHESDGRNGDISAFAECLPNAVPGLVGDYPRQYAVDVPVGAPLVRLVVISPAVPFADGPWDYSDGTERSEWTRSMVEGAHAAGIPWVVVALHKPCLSLGEYGCDPGGEIIDLLVDSGADLVISGHEHLYQRSVQLRTGSGCASIAPDAISPQCVVDRGSDLEAGGGTVFVTVGTGGTTLRDVHRGDADAAYFAAWSGANVEPSWGNLRLRVSAWRMEVGFVPSIGGFTDEFRLDGADRPTPAG